MSEHDMDGYSTIDLEGLPTHDEPVLIVDLPDCCGELTCSVGTDQHTLSDNLIVRATSGRNAVRLELTLEEGRRLRDWLIAQDMGGLTLNRINDLIGGES